MSCICRTCLSEITSNHYVDINLSEFARKQLKLCIPELNLDLVLEPVLCLKCVEALNAAYDFKSCCLQTEQRINAYVETLTIEQQHVKLDAVLGNNCNGINSMAIHCGNDITNDLTIVHDHSRTRHDLEDYKDIKEECSVTSEYCSKMLFDDCVKVNYDSFKDESITIEEHEWDSFIKSEMFDTDKDAEGVVEQCSESDYGKYIENIESSNSSVICAQSCSKQDNSVTETPEMVNRLESKDSFSTATWQRKINARRIAETSNNNSLKEIVKHKSTPKNHSKNGPYRLHKNKKNSNEQIDGTSVLHIDSLRDCKEIVTGTDGSSALEIDVNNYPNYLKCGGTSDLNVNIENNTLHPNPRDISALLSSNSFNDVSSQHSDSFSAQVKNYDFLDTIAEKLYKCNSCDYASTQQSLLLKHMTTHTREKQYKCNVCDYAYSRKYHLKRHVRSHTGEKPYKCNFCDYASCRKDDLKMHVRNHTGEKPYKCNSCGFASIRKGDLTVHARNHTGEKPYKCNSCDYASFQKSTLTVHMAKHTGEKPYKCNSCDYASFQKGNLVVHMAKHTREKPYKCNSCDYASFQKSTLKIHMAKHTGEKLYKCNVCDYATLRKYCLKIHVRIHTGEKPYKCNSCDYASSRKDDLKMHVRNHTGEKPYKCNSCGYASSRKSDLTVHVRNCKFSTRFVKKYA